MIKSGANQPWAHSINERLCDSLHLLPLEPPIYFVSGVGPTLPLNRSNVSVDATEMSKRLPKYFLIIMNVKYISNITNHRNHRRTSKCSFF